jgi:hypothetical protein
MRLHNLRLPTSAAVTVPKSQIETGNNVLFMVTVTPDTKNIPWFYQGSSCEIEAIDHA